MVVLPVPAGPIRAEIRRRTMSSRAWAFSARASVSGGAFLRWPAAPHRSCWPSPTRPPNAGVSARAAYLRLRTSARPVPVARQADPIGQARPASFAVGRSVSTGGNSLTATSKVALTGSQSGVSSSRARRRRRPGLVKHRVTLLGARSSTSTVGWRPAVVPGFLDGLGDCISGERHPGAGVLREQARSDRRQGGRSLQGTALLRRGRKGCPAPASGRDPQITRAPDRRSAKTGTITAQLAGIGRVDEAIAPTPTRGSTDETLEVEEIAAETRATRVGVVIECVQHARQQCPRSGPAAASIGPSPGYGRGHATPHRGARRSRSHQIHGPSTLSATRSRPGQLRQRSDRARRGRRALKHRRTRRSDPLGFEATYSARSSCWSVGSRSNCWREEESRQ